VRTCYPAATPADLAVMVDFLGLPGASGTGKDWLVGVCITPTKDANLTR